MAFKIKNKGSTSSTKQQTHQLGPELFISNDDHVRLIKHLQSRLDFASSVRAINLDRYRQVDKEVAGFIVLDEDDKKRQQDNVEGFGPKVYDVNIPLTAVQMDEAVTFFTTVFFPEEGPYNAVTDKRKQEIAKSFSSLMNQHADFYKHFTNFARGAYAGLKYNLGLWTVDWATTKGSVVQNGPGGIGAEIKDNQTVMQGNKLIAQDIYNTLLDPSVHPTELHEKGEFFATVDMETVFRLQLMEENGEIFGLNRIIDSNGKIKGTSQLKYYEEKPEIHGDAKHGTSEGKTNWINFLSANTSAVTIEGVEIVNMPIWIRPNQFGLSDVGVYQIWRLTLVNMVAVAAVQMTNAHGFLPLLATVPWDDEFGIDAKSYGEMLLPYQRFSSFQINIHQRASRKALYNLTIYDSLAIPEMANADVLGGKVPFNSTMDKRDINSIVRQFSDTPDTSNTMRDVENMDALMQKILPTDILKQVASLERATQYQAAATVQGANRRNLKIAKIIYTQAFGIGQKIQMYNILQFQESTEVIGIGGEVTEINPSSLREQKYEFTISDALRGLDKLILVETIKDIIALLVQNPQAAAEFNIADIIDYATTLIGDHTSFKQFRFENEFDKLNPEQKQIAFQLLQQALQQRAQQEGQGNQPNQPTQIAGVQ